MQPKWQHEVLVLTSGNAGREMVVDTLFKAVQNCQAQCGGQMDLDLLEGVRLNGCRQ
jgi:hypothetical protein